MAFIGRKPTNAPLTSDDIPNGIIGAEDLSSGLAKLTWDTTAKTSGFTAVSNTGYVCNTTSSAFTVTLPASPTAGDTIQIVDYAGTFATNALTISPNGNKINGVVENKVLTTNREAVIITYVDSTQGWISTSASNYGTVSLDPAPYSVDFLVIAGGGGGGTQHGGGGGAGGYRNSYSTETSGGGGSSEASLTFTPGTVYTITVGAGGTGALLTNVASGVTGSNSSISGTGITTITSNGGGGGASWDRNAETGGSGGGDAGVNISSAASGTANQGYAGGVITGTNGHGGGGGGGAGAVGGNGTGTAYNNSTAGAGGNGLASSITGSSVTRGGGGGGGSYTTGATGNGGGTGGGGNGGLNGDGGGGTNPTSGTANTGGGGGAAQSNNFDAAAGGSGVVILRMPTANYSGTTTGSPTVSTSGSDTILVYNASGSYTG